MELLSGDPIIDAVEPMSPRSSGSAICCTLARAAAMLGDHLRVQTIGFAVSRDGIGAKSINSYLIEQLTRSGHFPEQTGDQTYDATQPKLDAALNRKLLPRQTIPTLNAPLLRN